LNAQIAKQLIMHLVMIQKIYMDHKTNEIFFFAPLKTK